MQPIKHVLLYLIAGSRGGETRGRIVNSVLSKPLNAHKISKEVKLDYKTVQHHLDILEKNNILTCINKGNYGAVYIIAEGVEEEFGKIWERFG